MATENDVITEYLHAEMERGDYETDLQLAAELGKFLLERNKELEVALRDQQHTNDDQALQIEYLNKQIESVRNWSESRLGAYEQLDTTAQEMEKKNVKLERAAKSDKERIQSLCEQVRTLEGQAEERQAAVTRLQEAERQRHSDQRRMNVVGKRSGLRRYHSFENGFLDRITDAPGDPYLDEIHRQRDSIRYLKQQQAVERRRREDAERELCSLLQENSALETRLRDAGATWQEKLAAMQAQMQRAAIDSRKLCARCRSSLEVAPPRLESEVEHEDVREIRDAECLKLRSGGSLYASQEALRSYVDRREIATPPDGSPLLSEIHAHYHRLVQTYEEILQRRGAPPADAERCRRREEVSAEGGEELCTACMVKRTMAQARRDAAAAAASGLEHAPPVYKQLFKEIFEKLRKRYEEPADDKPAAGAAPNV